MTPPAPSFLAEARRSFYAALFASTLTTDAKGVPSNADRHSVPSVKIAKGIIDRIGPAASAARLAGQMAGRQFEEICCQYVRETFPKLLHMRPGHWEIVRGFGGSRLAIAGFDQYEHLAALETAARGNPALAAALGMDYLIKPDVVVIRYPEEEEVINAGGSFAGENEGRLTPIRALNKSRPMMHASISCKWTIRSDRAQNARSEAFNLVRNRKGRLPHIAVITGEPTPNRIASIALGTGDIDCVYHFALPELVDTVRALKFADAAEMLDTMISGKRLRDISDLPLDLVA